MDPKLVKNLRDLNTVSANLSKHIDEKNRILSQAINDSNYEKNSSNTSYDNKGTSTKRTN